MVSQYAVQLIAYPVALGLADSFRKCGLCLFELYLQISLLRVTTYL